MFKKIVCLKNVQKKMHTTHLLLYALCKKCKTKFYVLDKNLCNFGQSFYKIRVKNLTIRSKFFGWGKKSEQNSTVFGFEKFIIAKKLVI